MRQILSSVVRREIEQARGLSPNFNVLELARTSIGQRPFDGGLDLRIYPQKCRTVAQPCGLHLPFLSATPVDRLMADLLADELLFYDHRVDHLHQLPARVGAGGTAGCCVACQLKDMIDEDSFLLRLNEINQFASPVDDHV